MRDPLVRLSAVVTHHAPRFTPINTRTSCCSVETIWAAAVRLTAQRVSQHSKARFGQHLLGPARVERRAHRTFESAEEALHRPAPPITALPQMLGAHPAAPASAARAIGPMIQRPDDALHSPAFPALRVNPF